MRDAQKKGFVILGFQNLPFPSGEVILRNPVRVIEKRKSDITDWRFLDTIASDEVAVCALSYELNSLNEELHYESAPLLKDWPDLWCAVYKKDQLQLSSDFRQENEYYTAAKDPNSSFELRFLGSNMSPHYYKSAITKIKRHIYDGDVYQINFTVQNVFEFKGDPYMLYRAFLKQQPVPYNAYLSLGDGRFIVSGSPELFFRVAHGKIVTKPMKGTRPRDNAGGYKELVSSEKDKAENVMIVDLMRNDIGRICCPGSVTVEKLFNVEEYSTVYQMTSTVSGVLDPGVKRSDILRALFPAGSITGAPKKRTMEIIGALEKNARQFYCGAIGFVDGAQDFMVFNVAIRTAMIDIHRGIAVYGSGGGIVYDSKPEDEYREMHTKLRAFAELCVQ